MNSVLLLVLNFSVCGPDIMLDVNNRPENILLFRTGNLIFQHMKIFEFLAKRILADYGRKLTLPSLAV